MLELDNRAKPQIPIEFGIWFNHGCKLLEEKKEEEAEAYFDRCAKACPEAWLGVACEDLKAGMKAQAVKRFEQVIRHATNKKTIAVACNNFGMMLSNNGARGPAEKYFRIGFENWKMGDVAANIALSCMYRHDMEEARKWIKKAVLLDPANESIRFNYALIKLRDGDFVGGFADYESRWKNQNSGLRKLCVFRKEWNGQPIPGKTLLLYAEQGAGDTLQMLRYGPLAKERVGRLLLAVQDGIGSIAERQGCWDQVYEYLPDLILSAQVPHWDYQLPMMSLPRVFRTTIETVPTAPYLTYPAGAAIHFKPGFRVGFCWAGSLSHADDIWRSTHIEDWEPLFETGARFYSFQLGARTVDLIDQEYPVCDLANALKTYDDSARYISEMDLVITVDTSLAHLAGALGKPVWLLTPFSPDWRWMFGRDDSPWYPSMRLFRQTKERDWAGVFQRVKEKLTNAIQQTREHSLGNDVCQPA